MTSEMGEDFNAWNKEKQEKRSKNREDSAQMLLAAGVEFLSKNNGAHLIVTTKAGIFDFWPGTGLWKMRGATQTHRGVRKLLKIVVTSPTSNS